MLASDEQALQKANEKVQETVDSIRKRELQLQLLAMKPLRADINNQRLNKSIDKVFPSIDQMVDYLSLPITYLMQKNTNPKQSGISLDDTVIVGQNSGSSGGKSNDSEKAGTVKKIIVFVFEAVDPSSKQEELLGHLKQLAASIVK